MNNTRLSVNINKVAWLRNGRGGNTPNLKQVAIDCQRFGADGVTVHPRPDERHITLEDVYDLKPIITTEYNIEGYPNERFLKLIEDIKPEQCTLVPDPPDVLTSNAGWDTVKHFDFLKDVIARIKETGSRISLFMEHEPKHIEHAKKAAADRIELYTGPYADMFSIDKKAAVKEYVQSAKIAHDLGLGINAGHDLNTQNLNYFWQNVPNLLEVSIGHALISDALYWGLENTIQIYKRQLTGYLGK